MNNTARDDEFHYLSRSPSHHVPTQQELSSSKAAFLLRIHKDALDRNQFKRIIRPIASAIPLLPPKPPSESHVSGGKYAYPPASDQSGKLQHHGAHSSADRHRIDIHRCAVITNMSAFSTKSIAVSISGTDSPNHTMNGRNCEPSPARSPIRTSYSSG